MRRIFILTTANELRYHFDMNEQTEKLAGFYHHIDNGGVNVDILMKDGNILIDFNTGYYGYPDVSSRLNLGGSINSGTFKSSVPQEILEQLGKACFAAAAKL